MNFKEAFARYQAGTATPEEAAYIAAEIEKNELLNDYLAGQLPAMPATPPVEQAMVSQVKKTVRRRLAQNVLISVTAVILLALALWYILLPMYDRSFYNPNQGSDPEWQFFMDVAAATELYFPGYVTNSASAEPQGLGRYDIRITQDNYFDGGLTSYTDRLDRGQLQNHWAFYHFPPGNAFYDAFDHNTTFVDSDGTTYYGQTPDSRQHIEDELALLPASCWASAYVSFAEDISLTELISLIEDSHSPRIDWAAVRVSPKDRSGQMVGFDPYGRGLIIPQETLDEARYPYFELAHREGSAVTPEMLTQHFESLLAYLGQRQDFLDAFLAVNAINIGDKHQDMLAYVQEKGIAVYGLLVSGPVDSVQQFISRDNINSVMIQNVKISMYAD